MGDPYVPSGCLAAVASGLGAVRGVVPRLEDSFLLGIPAILRSGDPSIRFGHLALPLHSGRRTWLREARAGRTDRTAAAASLATVLAAGVDQVPARH